MVNIHNINNVKQKLTVESYMLCSQTLLQVAATLSLCQKLQNSKVESKTDYSPSAFLQCYNLGNDYLYACCVRVNWSRTTEQSLTTRNLTCKNRRFEQFDCLHQSVMHFKTTLTILCVNTIDNFNTAMQSLLIRRV